MINKAVYLVALLSLAALACNRQGSTSLPSEETTLEDTTLGPGDVFEIRVFGEKDLTGKYQVGPDGSIRYPFLGVIPVGGKEADEVSQEIADRLREQRLLLDPHVSVFIEESNSKRISVLGAVAKPGTFPIVPGITVVQAVSAAGGFTALASKDDTVVTRRSKGKLQRYRVLVSDVMRGNADDFPLRAGDIVFVPERVF